MTETMTLRLERDRDCDESRRAARVATKTPNEITIIPSRWQLIQVSGY